MRLASTLVCVASVLGLFTAACGSDDVTVGKTNQALTTKKDGSPTGDGSTCSWTETIVYDAVTSDGTTRVTADSYAVGDDFKSLDGCNDCTCTAKGIMCTVRVCSGGSSTGGGSGGGGSSTPGSPPTGGSGGGVACPDLAKQCPDGSYVGASGPDCLFQCGSTPSGACSNEAKLCPDGKTYVSRTGPSCEFAACP